MIRLAMGIVCALCGLGLAGLSFSALSVVGTEKETTTKAFSAGDGAYALVLDEAIVPFEHTEATLTVTSDQELFLGAANGVDVDDYLTGVAHEEITDVDFPKTAHHRLIAGEPQPEAPAPERDWWTAEDTGTTVSRSFDLDAEPQVIVVTPAESAGTLEGAQVTLSMKVGEVLGMALLGFAGAAAFLGLAAFVFLRMWVSRFRPRPKRVSGAGPSGARRRRRAESAGAARRGSGSEAGTDSGSGDGLGDSTRRSRRRGGAAPAGGVSTLRGRSRRSVSALAGLSAGALVLSGCGTDFPQPTRPELTPYERPALEPGQAGPFLASYSERLDEALRGEPEALEAVQTGPLLERTRAEMLMAEHSDSTLGAASYADVRAGGPMFESYPLWFMAFATPRDEDIDDAEAMLVTRDSAAGEWTVAQSVFVPQESVPTVLADERGAVEEAPPEHEEAAARVVDGAVSYLTDGKAPEGGPDYAAAGFKDFRDYVGGLGAEDTGFEDLEVECSPYDGMPLSDYALATEGGGVSFAEVRCQITVNVPEDYFVDLGDEIEAVMTTDDEGSTIRIDISQPMLVTTEGASAEVASPGWYMLASATSD
jgi:hypothetical protein